MLATSRTLSNRISAARSRERKRKRLEYLEQHLSTCSLQVAPPLSSRILPEEKLPPVRSDLLLDIVVSREVWQVICQIKPVLLIANPTGPSAIFVTGAQNVQRIGFVERTQETRAELRSDWVRMSRCMVLETFDIQLHHEDLAQTIMPAAAHVSLRVFRDLVHPKRLQIKSVIV